jgi:hypothetical protein
MPGAPCGYVEGSIFLESSKWQSRIRLPLGGKLLGKVHSDPEAIFFGRLKRGSAVGRVIQINGIDAQPAALRARVYPDSLTSVFESKLDGATRCTLRFNGKGDTGIVNGKLIISEEGGREFISVPVTGNIE